MSSTTLHHLDGLPVILVDMPESTSTTVQIFVKAGSVYEQRETNGISHFLEHMFFKWGVKYPNAKAVAQAVDIFGGEFNAYTSDEIASYYVKSAPEYVHQSIDVLADMMVHSTFPRDELEIEKGAVVEEIKMRKDNPQSLIRDQRGVYMFGDTARWWPTIGTVDNVMSFTQEHLFAHKENLYTKDNMIIVVCGPIAEASSSLLGQIWDLFQSIPHTKKISYPDLIPFLPTSRRAFHDQTTQQNHMILAAPGLAVDDTRIYAAHILTTLLGGPMSSRLFQEVREKRGLCYYIGAGHIAGEKDGVFVIKSWLSKEKFEEGVETIFAEIAKVVAGDVHEDEFQQSIGYSLGKLKMGIETSDEMAERVGYDYLVQKRLITIPEIVSKYQSLQLSDLQSVAQMLTPDKLYLYYIQ